MQQRLLASLLADLATPRCCAGLDEAVAIAKVVQFVQAADYAKFTRIVFDTAPTGHTLRLLSLPDFVDASLGKVIRLRKKLAGAASGVSQLVVITLASVQTWWSGIS